MSSSGLKLAIKYSLPPCRLGFCGPARKLRQEILYDFVVGKEDDESAVRKILSSFEAMYPYLRLIAAKNGISDPLDERVVRALWVGSSLLEKVTKEDLRELILNDFVKPALLSPAEAEERAARVRDGMVPHHSFHVFVLGSITGRVDLGGALRELCRIGWGQVGETGDGKVTVRYHPLALGKKLARGGEKTKEWDWDSQIVPGVSRGDWVSFHWGRICDVLSEEDVSDLERYTLRNISALNK